VDAETAHDLLAIRLTLGQLADRLRRAEAVSVVSTRRGTHSNSTRLVGLAQVV
jgi:hypothetical protein